MNQRPRRSIGMEREGLNRGEPLMQSFSWPSEIAAMQLHGRASNQENASSQSIPSLPCCTVTDFPCRRAPLAVRVRQRDGSIDVRQLCWTSLLRLWIQIYLCRS